MKKTISALLALTAALLAVFSFASCKSNTIDVKSKDELIAYLQANPGAKIAVPNDPTNEARALLLLKANGILGLRADAGIAATKADITENPYKVEIVELEAAQLPLKLADVAFAVINSNYAIPANLNPVSDSIVVEGSYSAYSNILAVRSGNATSDKTKALVAALQSRTVADFIRSTYNGAVIGVVENPGDGYDATVDYEALKGQTITVAASPTPHAEILEQAKELLAAKGITLKITVYTDYVQPNNVVEQGECDANYFQHTPYLENFNTENRTHIVPVAAIHVEPMGLYCKK